MKVQFCWEWVFNQATYEFKKTMKIDPYALKTIINHEHFVPVLNPNNPYVEGETFSDLQITDLDENFYPYSTKNDEIILQIYLHRFNNSTDYSREWEQEELLSFFDTLKIERIEIKHLRGKKLPLI